MDTPRKTNRLMFIMLIYILIVPVIMSIIANKTSLFAIDSPAGHILYNIAVIVLPLFIITKVEKVPLTFLIPIKKLRWKNVLLIILISISVQPILSLISVISGMFFKNSVSEMLYENMRYGYFSMIISIAVMPAICEELIFRGIMLSGYKKAGIKKAAIITGLFFAIAHLNEQQFFYAMFMGILFAYFVYYTNSIFSSILSHFVINATQITALYASGILYPQHIDTAPVMETTDKLILLQESAYTALVFTPMLIGLFALFAITNRKLKLDMIDHIMKHSKLIVINPEPEDDKKIFTLSFWLTVVFFIFVISCKYIPIFVSS
ncbi:MAG: CPBP family intramembrane metalloprotease [Firmicutes bacterium]|nr:CPBP family intramembrane metalloprotease [Bacillota bacterium]